MSTGRINLEDMLNRADKIDFTEGLLAYTRYNAVMQSIAELYEFPLHRVAAVFCSLSPNNDYIGNLRSTVSVLYGLKNKVPRDKIIVSTYKHCRDRAISYALGESDFLSQTKGLKITNFYHNLTNPLDNRWVTIDGHMCAAWRGQQLTMKEAIVKGVREYREIADAVKAMAFQKFTLPNQVQAIIWFTRKRVFQVKYKAQLGLFSNADDQWETLQHVESIKPFPYPVVP